MRKDKFYITTAIYYTNAAPHIGHAIEVLFADVMARYQRLFGKDVYFLTGTDEHGQKIYKTATEEGTPVEDFVAQKSAIYQNLDDQWDISNNDFIRTTENRHIKGAQEFWKASMANGDIYKKSYTGLYCVGCEAFKTEKELVNGVCPDHPTPPSTLMELSEENYFFKLSKYQKDLEKLFKKNSHFVYPDSRYNEMKNILKEGLEDVSISRSKEKLTWGISVPGDDTQVMYVWFDALTNYVTALGYGTKDNKPFKKYWPADAHVIGKEINRFHSLLWPAMLMSAGLELPKRIAVHGWITLNGQKMSKTIGNVVDPLKLVQQYPVEAVRYFLTREVPFVDDGDFSEEKFRVRHNADLANGLGNLANRILTMIEKYSDSVIPETTTPDGDLIKALEKTWKEYAKHMEMWRFDLALAEAWKFIAFCDRQISDRKPWSMVKEGKIQEVEDFLYHLAEALRHIAVMIWPVMPETTERIFAQLGLDIAKESSKPLSELQNWVQLMVGNRIGKPEALFPRL